MHRFLLILILLGGSVAIAQNHLENIRKINTIAQAEDYAADFKEVTCGLMTAETDVFFFDEIDTSNMKHYVGITKSFWGRNIKLLKDTSVYMVHVQVITFDLNEVSKDSAELSMASIQERLSQGETYWKIKRDYTGAKVSFDSEPEVVFEAKSKFGITDEQVVQGAQYRWSAQDGSGKVGILIVDGEPEFVPGFYTISFLDNGKSAVRR